jgi:uncharacterized hydrophobic protein (TIGR00271 family)
MGVWSNMIRDNQFQPQDVPRFEGKLFFEGDRRRRQFEQFGVLLVLATIIATAGIIANSTATVIGAMIVAPLMTPIMATTAALTMGQVQRAARALALVGIGVISVIGMSALLGLLYTGVLDFRTNPQVTGRVSPTVVDLIAALASGAAGAFCMSREDISDSLAGVAIAISLVPPLCVVGLSMQAGYTDEALGAMLLFVTNFLSILLAGGAVLAILGLNKAANARITGPARRNAYLAIGLATIIVSVPLIATGRQATVNFLGQQQSSVVVDEWLEGSDYLNEGVTYQGDTVRVVITGVGQPPAFDGLVQALRSELRRPVVVSLKVVPAEEFVSE